MWSFSDHKLRNEELSEHNAPGPAQAIARRIQTASVPQMLSDAGVPIVVPSGKYLRDSMGTNSNTDSLGVSTVPGTMSSMSTHDGTVVQIREHNIDRTLLDMFERYCVLDFSRENILFLEDVAGLRSLPRKTQLEQLAVIYEADRILRVYVEPQSPLEINIMGAIRERLIRLRASSSPSAFFEKTRRGEMFDEAEKTVLNLCNMDTVRKFVHSVDLIQLSGVDEGIQSE